MTHPDYLLQIAKQQQKEYFKSSEQSRLAHQLNGVRPNNLATIPSVFTWLGDLLALLSHRTSKMRQDFRAEQHVSEYPEDCVTC